jgi:aminoglycoside phosphotransferase (APT) family kinase protein
VRLGRAGDPANDPHSALREGRIVSALTGTGVPVPRVFGSDDALAAVAYERVPGDSDLERETPERQRGVYRHYAECLAALHELDAQRFAASDLPRPASAEECALRELERVSDSLGKGLVEPLASFGVAWLRRNAPREVDRIALLHGDAGTPNFLYAGERVTALVDWEWAHLGDPMEDLGNSCVHASFHPSGDLPDFLAHYARARGIAVDLDRVRYYRAHLMVRSVIALAAATARWDPHVPVALNLCFRVVSDRICCEAIAEAAGIALERPELPELRAQAPSLYEVVARNLEQDVLPAVSGSFPRNRLEAAVLLVRSLEREQVLGPALERIECDELGALLGVRPADLTGGLAELDRRIAERRAPDEARVLNYLARRAWRQELLLAPVVSLFPDRKLRPID